MPKDTIRNRYIRYVAASTYDIARRIHNDSEPKALKRVEKVLDTIGVTEKEKQTGINFAKGYHYRVGMRKIKVGMKMFDVN